MGGEDPTWSLFVEKTGRTEYRAGFSVDGQNFTLARCSDGNEAEEHCTLIAQSFMTSMTKLFKSVQASATRKAAGVAADMGTTGAKVAKAILEDLDPADRIPVRSRYLEGK